MQTVSPSSGVVHLDQDTDNIFIVNMIANVTSMVFDSPDGRAGQRVELHFVQDATGSRTVTLPSSVKLVAGALTLTTTASKRDVLSLRQVSNPADAGGVKYVETGRSLNVAA